MTTGSDIDKVKRRIAAFEAAGLDEKVKELRVLLKEMEGAGAPGPAMQEAPASPSPTASDEIVLDVNREAFERGGQQWIRPVKPCAVNGHTLPVVYPTKVKGAQVWLAFESTDGFKDFIAVAYDGEGAFKLKDVLEALEVPYAMEGSRIKFRWPKGLPVSMRFLDGQGEQHNQVRLVEALKGHNRYQAAT